MTESLQPKLPSIKRFPDRQIASITEPFKDENGIWDVRLISKGFLEKEFEKHFPADPLAVIRARKKGLPEPRFNMLMLVRSLIFEEYIKTGKNRKKGNIRHLFYTNIIHALTEIMKVTNITSLNTTINTAWKQLIESGLITYEGMNIRSAKDKLIRSFARHSPYSNLIICVEKESYLEELSWTAELFRTTIIFAGGQPSTASLRTLIHSFVKSKSDLNKPFYLLVITDLDPAGWYIQETFASQIEKSIKYYNDNKGEVKEIIRLFLRLDQVKDNLIQKYAISAKDKEAKTSQAKKTSKTKIKYFKDKLGPQWKRLFINNEMKKIELDAIDADQMELSIVEELLELIDDQSLILIPEIMDEVEKQRENVIQDFYESYKEKEINEIIDEYLEPLKEAKDEIEKEHKEKKYKAQSDFYNIEREADNLHYLIKDEIDNLIELIIEKYNDYTDSLVSDELEEIKDHKEEIESLEEEIEKYKEKIKTLEEEIEEKIGFHKEEINELDDNLEQTHTHLEKKRSLFLDPAEKVRDIIFLEITADWKIFEKKLSDFKSQQKGKFGSYLRSVEKHFQDSLNSEKIPVFFDEVESDSNVQIQMAYLLTTPKLLLNENKSCLEHPKPAFRESYLLQNALDSDNFKNTKRNPDLSKFRNSFSEPLEKAFKKFMKRKLLPIPVELDSVVDLPEEYSNELKDLIQEIRNEIAKNKLYSFLNYHPEDLKSQKEKESQEKQEEEVE